MNKLVSKIKGWFYREKHYPGGVVYKRFLFFTRLIKKNVSEANRRSDVSLAELSKKYESLRSEHNNFVTCMHGVTKLTFVLMNKLYGIESDMHTCRQNLVSRIWSFNHYADVLEIYNTTSIPSRLNRVICYFDDKTTGSGLTDRIRTTLTAYIIAVESGLDFYVYHEAGFKLTDYLLPNEVDWRIEKNEICFNLQYATPLLFLNTFRRLLRCEKDYHIYQSDRTVETFSLPEELRGKYTDFSVFNTLYRFSPAILSIVNKYFDIMGLAKREYVAVHCRFLNFFEQVEINGSVKSSPEQRDKMIKKVKATIKGIYDSIGLPIILFSDSNSFLEIEHDEYVRVVPGKAGHVAAHGGEEDVIEKVFVDLYIISQAKAVYSLVGKNLYTSGFSRFGARIGNVPLYRLNVDQKS